MLQNEQLTNRRKVGNLEFEWKKKKMLKNGLNDGGDGGDGEEKGWGWGGVGKVEGGTTS